MRKAAGLLFLLGAMNILSGQNITIRDEFHTFTRSRSTVALEDRSDKELWEIQGPSGDITCTDGILSLKGKPGTEIRVFSKQKFRYGTVSTRVRFDTVGRGFNIYIGFATKEPWVESVAWTQFTDSGKGILLTGTNKTMPKQIDAVQTPEFKAGVWHDLKIVWEAEKAELFVDGVSRGVITEKPAIPQYGLPMLFAIYSMSKPYSLSIDYVEVTGGKVTAGTDGPPKKVTTVTMPVMPKQPVCPEPEDCAASVKTAGNSATLENKYYRMKFDGDSGLQLKQLYNKYLRKNLINSGASPLVMLHEGTKLLASPANSDVKFRKTDASTLGIQLDYAQEKLKLELSLSAASDSPELLIHTDLTNYGDKKRRISVTLPILNGLQIGDTMAADEFFFPFESGMAGELDCELVQPYGVTAFFPLMSVYNPEVGGGCYAYIRETQGYSNVLLLKRQSGSTFTGSSYNVTGQTLQGIFPDAPGTHLGFNHTAFDLEAGKSGKLPVAVIGVHKGNFHEPMQNYTDFARKTWFRKRFATPRWYMDSYGFLSAHVSSGMHLMHAGKGGGFYDEKLQEYRYGRQVTPKEQNAVMEFAGIFDNNSKWADMNLDDVVEQGIPVMNYADIGNYNYNKRRGGLAALQAEIKTIHENGGRFTFYTWPQACARGTDLDKQYGNKWARMNMPGRYDIDYTSDDMGWNFCCYEEEFGEVLSDIYAKRLAETGADGYRLDVFSRTVQCFNPAHSHYDGTLRSASNPPAAGEVLEKFISKARKVSPEAIVTTEHGASDYLSQFHDGYFSENINWMGESGMWEPYRALNKYGLVFQRFYFPEIKTWIHGPANRKLALQMSLFNAVGYACSDPAGAVGARTLSENGDAFNSGITPTPMIPVLREKLFANFFPGAEKRIWCIWNRDKKEIQGKLLKFAPKSDCHYVELYGDTQFDLADDCLQGTIPPESVAVVAELPEIIQWEIEGRFLNLSLNTENPDNLDFELVYDSDSYDAKPVLMHTQDGKAYFKLRSEYKKLIVKVYKDNYLLDEAIIK